MLRVHNSKGFLSSVYLNDLPRTPKQIFTPYKIFVFRVSSAIAFKNAIEFQERTKVWIEEIQKDKRFSEIEKSKLLKFINNMKLTEKDLI